MNGFNLFTLTLLIKYPLIFQFSNHIRFVFVTVPRKISKRIISTCNTTEGDNLT